MDVILLPDDVHDGENVNDRLRAIKVEYLRDPMSHNLNSSA